MNIIPALLAIDPSLPTREKADAVIAILQENTVNHRELLALGHHQLARDTLAKDKDLFALLVWHELECLLTPTFRRHPLVIFADIANDLALTTYCNQKELVSDANGVIMGVLRQVAGVQFDKLNELMKECYRSNVANLVDAMLTNGMREHTCEVFKERLAELAGFEYEYVHRQAYDDAMSQASFS